MDWMEWYDAIPRSDTDVCGAIGLLLLSVKPCVPANAM